MHGRNLLVASPYLYPGLSSQETFVDFTSWKPPSLPLPLMHLLQIRKLSRKALTQPPKGTPIGGWHLASSLSIPNPLCHFPDTHHRLRGQVSLSQSANFPGISPTLVH